MRHSHDMKSIALTGAGILLLSLILGCDQQPISTTATAVDTPAGSIADADFRPLAFRLPTRAGKTLQVPVYAERLLTAESGGRVELRWDSGIDDGPRVRARLEVPPRALSHDTMISIGLENPALAMVSVDLEFGAHGTQFLVPAKLQLRLSGLALAGTGGDDDDDDDGDDDGDWDDDDRQEFGLYWFDESAGVWSPVPANKLKVDADEGSVEGTWYLNHFSRYSLAD